MSKTQKLKKQNQNIDDKFAMKVESLLFGETPASVPKGLDRCLNSSQSVFGHIAIGSEFPSFHKLVNIVASQPNSAKILPSLPLQQYEISCLNKMTNSALTDVDVPDVLRAVGLSKLVHRLPKCYGNKKKIVHLPQSEVTLGAIDFGSNVHFGKLHWE